jgi:hypothetical protein
VSSGQTMLKHASLSADSICELTVSSGSRQVASEELAAAPPLFQLKIGKQRSVHHDLASLRRTLRRNRVVPNAENLISADSLRQDAMVQETPPVKRLPFAIGGGLTRAFARHDKGTGLAT